MSDKHNNKILAVDYGKPNKLSMMIERDKVAKYLIDCIDQPESFKKALTLSEKKA